MRVIAPIALLDSASIIPVCLVPLTRMLASRRSTLANGALIAGISITDLVCRGLVYSGLQQAF